MVCKHVRILLGTGNSSKESIMGAQDEVPNRTQSAPMGILN